MGHSKMFSTDEIRDFLYCPEKWKRKREEKLNSQAKLHLKNDQFYQISKDEQDARNAYHTIYHSKRLPNKKKPIRNNILKPDVEEFRPLPSSYSDFLDDFPFYLLLIMGALILLPLILADLNLILKIISIVILIGIGMYIMPYLIMILYVPYKIIRPIINMIKRMIYDKKHAAVWKEYEKEKEEADRIYQQQKVQYQQELENELRKWDKIYESKQKEIEKIIKNLFKGKKYPLADLSLNIYEESFQLDYDEKTKKMIVVLDRKDTILPFYVHYAHEYDVAKVAANLLILKNFFNNLEHGVIHYKNRTTNVYLTSRVKNMLEQALKNIQERKSDVIVTTLYRCEQCSLQRSCKYAMMKR
ncbi:hypothetical protein [Thermoflavimicrobium daqui]|nr:hypothetical protein [Thermoflavimicrobium daqui]